MLGLPSGRALKNDVILLMAKIPMLQWRRKLQKLPLKGRELHPKILTLSSMQPLHPITIFQDQVL